MGITMDIEKVVRVYQTIRDARSAKKREWETEDGKLSEQQDVIERALLGYMTDSNIKSLRTETGTVYKEKETIPQGSDWDAFYAWVAENNAFEALERRIKRTFITEYMETNEGKLPPGVSVFSRFKVGIRRTS